MAPPRGLGMKASIAISFLVGVMFVIHTISSISSGVLTSPDDTIVIQNHTTHRIHHRLVRQHPPSTADNTLSRSGAGQEKSSSSPLNLFEEVKICKTENIHNFFTDLKYSFLSMLEDLESKPLDSEMFLNCSADLAGIFGKLSSTAFAPMKSNFAKNLQIVVAKFETDREKYSTIESIVMEDVNINNQKSATSVTDALLWVTRSLLFIAELFGNFENKEKFHQAVSIAYESTIKQYHNFFIKSLFSMIAAAVPSKETAIASFASDSHDVSKSAYQTCLFESLDIYNEALFAVCAKIERFLLSKADITVIHRK